MTDQEKRDPAVDPVAMNGIDKDDFLEETGSTNESGDMKASGSGDVKATASGDVKASASGDVNDLKSAHYPDGVVHMYRLRSSGVSLAELRIKALVALAAGYRVKLFAVGGVTFHLRELNIVEQRIYIQTRSAHDYRELSPAEDVLYRLIRELYVVCRGKAHIAVKNAYEVVRYALHLLRCRLCGGYVHSFVYLHGIGGYDLAAVFLRELDPEPCFSRSCRTGYREHERFHVFIHIYLPARLRA